MALKRRKLWQALYDIEEIRKQIITLHAYRKQLKPKRNKDIDLMEQEFRDKKSELLIGSLSIETLFSKLKLSMKIIFEEIKIISEELNVAYNIENLETAL